MEVLLKGWGQNISPWSKRFARANCSRDREHFTCLSFMDQLCIHTYHPVSHIHSPSLSTS